MKNNNKTHLIEPLQDKNFDNIADKFQRNIYQGLKGKIRLRVLDEDIQEYVFRDNNQAMSILDAGAGSGQYAAHLAAQGHQMVLADISQNMLDLAKSNFVTAGHELTAHQFLNLPVQELHKYLSKPYQLVLFHAVLEWLVDPEPTLKQVLDMVADGGYCSLMFFNRNSLIMQHVIFGNLKILEKDHIRGLGKKTLTPTNPLEPEQVYAWLEKAGMKILVKTGVRVIHDYSPKDRLADYPENYLKLEQQYCRKEPFLSLGRYIHLICQKVKSCCEAD